MYNLIIKNYIHQGLPMIQFTKSEFRLSGATINYSISRRIYLSC
ncbi:hypothetical protein QIG_3726 [Clostridioides difficile DA00065]|nr:hypothetical protein QIG_3726 [Clostridioides difficile DA00065]CCL04032.1 hypothetical protein BN167_2110028 [Clostridioides difficile E13]